ncbi:hypothetical protein [Dictyobacter arantiisoli]|nr:hypothetical protein [Dictyobacter arantiisoli]
MKLSNLFGNTESVATAAQNSAFELDDQALATVSGGCGPSYCHEGGEYQGTGFEFGGGYSFGEYGGWGDECHHHHHHHCHSWGWGC